MNFVWNNHANYISTGTATSYQVIIIIIIVVVVKLILYIDIWCWFTSNFTYRCWSENRVQVSSNFSENKRADNILREQNNQQEWDIQIRSSRNQRNRMCERESNREFIQDKIDKKLKSWMQCSWLQKHHWWDHYQITSSKSLYLQPECN